MKKHLKSIILAGVMVMPAAPGAAVTCRRDLVPGATIDVYGPQGTKLSSGGGKTTLEARLPYGVSIR